VGADEAQRHPQPDENLSDDDEQPHDVHKAAGHLRTLAAHIHHRFSTVAVRALVVDFNLFIPFNRTHLSLSLPYNTTQRSIPTHLTFQSNTARCVDHEQYRGGCENSPGVGEQNHSLRRSISEPTHPEEPFPPPGGGSSTFHTPAHNQFLRNRSCYLDKIGLDR